MMRMRIGPAGCRCVAARHRGRGRRDRESHAHQRALAELALDFEIGAVALGDAVDHRQPQAGAARALGGEERFETAAARVLVHAHARVLHFEQHDLRPAARGEARCGW